MARPLRLEFPGACYHVMSRGNERKDTFRASEDYRLFLQILQQACERFHVGVVCYCLMPNHVHLLVHTPEANLSKFMKRLLGVYTMRFNHRYERVGHLFQGRYKAFVVQRETYLLELSRYIHLNPCRAGLVSAPERYPWSSVRAYLGTDVPPFLDRDVLFSVFPSPKRYAGFLREGLRGSTTDPLAAVRRGVFLGSEAFVEQFREKLRSTPPTGIARQREMLKIPWEELGVRLEGLEDAVKMYGMWKWGRWTQQEIGRRFSKTKSAVNHAIKGVQTRLSRDHALRARVEDLEERLSTFGN